VLRTHPGTTSPKPFHYPNIMANAIKFSPGIPIPAVFDIQERIQTLRSYLDPKNPQYQPEQQHPNIKFAIKLYEDGKMDGLEHVYIMDGVVVTQEEALEGSTWVWSEVYISLSNSVP
jgi:hypothetical protein